MIFFGRYLYYNYALQYIYAIILPKSVDNIREGDGARLPREVFAIKVSFQIQEINIIANFRA